MNDNIVDCFLLTHGVEHDRWKASR